METKRKKKQEVWPWAVVVAFCIFIGGLSTGITIMLKQDVPLVAEDYYVKELAYQDQIDKQNRVSFHSNAPKVALNDEREGALVEFPGKIRVENGEGKIVFFRPSDPSMDFEVPVNPDDNGSQYIGLAHITKGLWQVQIEWVEAGETYYTETHLVL